MKFPAERMKSQESKSYGMVPIAYEMERSGMDVIHLALGRPSFDTPDHIKRAAIQALEDGHVHYDDVQGYFPLREAIAAKLVRLNQLPASADDVVVTVGLSQAAFATYAAMVDPGDEVIFLDPYYPQHLPRVTLMGGVPVLVPFDADDGWSMNPDLIETAITDRSVAITIVNPSNPVGRVFTRVELEAIADIAIRHDLIVISDEVYEAILFDGHRHISIASLPGMWERTVTLIAFTKAYAMDGWRIGYATAPRHLLEPIIQVVTSETTHPTLFAQHGALAAVAGDQQCVADMVGEDRIRRDYVVEHLSAMPGVECGVPEGTIYAFPDFSAAGRSSDDLVRDVLEVTGVALESGSFYGPSGEGYVRLCFGSQPLPRLVEGMDRLSTYMESRL